MDMIKGKFRRLGKGKIAKATLISLAVAVVMAAATFIPNDQPWGYLAPPALTSRNFSAGTAVAYVPWFETGSYHGDLLALPITSTGAVNLLAPLWRAATVLDFQHHLFGRRIVTTDGAGLAMPFRFLDLTPAQQLQVGSEPLLNYVRGDRSNEGAGGLRSRSRVLGDIVHSGPVYVGKPAGGYIYGNYLTFANSNAGRIPRVYVGANDGMLHAFDAASGTEVFAYVPSMVMGNLPWLAVHPYAHKYYVDGFLTAEDAQFGAAWHTVLVGGLGAGGKGYYALDVTSPSAATEAEAAGKILWEFNSNSVGAGNLGFSYSRPSIVRLASGVWAAIVANGYLSATGAASLYVLNIQTGAVIREMITADLTANGLSSPTVIDLDADGHADVAYAGDLNGNLWKFDLNAGSIAFGGLPLFQTALVGGVRQPITTAPEVGRHPNGGVMVYVGTGRLFGTDDGEDETTQAVYGIWDDGSGPATIAQLRANRLKSVLHASGQTVRTVTALKPDWAVHRGWVTPTEIFGATALEKGERVIQDILLRDGRIQFMTVDPTVAIGGNWFIQLDAMSGGAPDKVIIDISADLVLNVADNADGNGDGVTAEVAEDRVVGQYQNSGLASRPVTGVIGGNIDAALINHLTAIPPIVLPPEPGLAGGHFDVDTSHLLSAFEVDNAAQCMAIAPPPSIGCKMDQSETTDGHEHQFDDVHNITYIDYFNLPGIDGDKLYQVNSPVFGVPPGSLFILTMANTDLSPGGIIEINGVGMSAGAYRGLQDRYLSGTLAAGESFPTYKLSAPSAAEALAGVVQLTGLKLTFDVNAILTGTLLPTKTSAVKENRAGALNEYRNGALMVQALDASGVSGGFALNGSGQEYVAVSTALHSSLGYATAGLFWETTVFWHWGGEPYGDALWQPLYDSCVVAGLGGCEHSSDDDDPPEPEPPPPIPAPGDPPAPPAVAVDPGQIATNTAISGDNNLGRLFWRELVPEE